MFLLYMLGENHKFIYIENTVCNIIYSILIHWKKLMNALILISYQLNNDSQQCQDDRISFEKKQFQFNFNTTICRQFQWVKKVWSQLFFDSRTSPNFWIMVNHMFFLINWMNDRLSLFTLWTYREGATLKRKAYNEICSGNSLNVCICSRTA